MYSRWTMSEKLCDVGGGITLCYETYGDSDDPAALLIMGLGAQMVTWQDDFCEQLAARGLYVVRFDNRDIGRSTHLQGPPPSLLQLLRYSVPARYTLADMAQDAVGLMNDLAIDRAHVIGASMGGMIAQTLAARHPARVRSLVSMMSSTGGRWVGRPALSSYAIFLRKAPTEREAFIEHATQLFAKIGSRGIPQDTEGVRKIAALSFDRELDRTGAGRQLAAIIASGDRTAELGGITAPTLVIHGTVDPLVSPSGGRATARAIPGAELTMIEGMGHDLPRVLWPRLIDALAAHAAESDRLAERHPALGQRA
jgi:pimeloyl-ACP methyl ester carboxylesterase